VPSLAEVVRTAPTRRFRSDPIAVVALSRAARRARIASWRLLPVADAATRQAIRDVHLRHWHSHLAETGGLDVLAADDPAGRARSLRAADAFAHDLHEAPLHLALLARSGGGLRDGAIGELRAALEAEGLGAAALPLSSSAAGDLRDLLELEAGVEIAGLLVVGARR
jgi:hypothetical protein